MDEKDSPILDVELSLHDVQNLSDSKALSAFFAHLGYNTNAQVRQSPANLGISAEGILRSIKNIELIADQDGLFQVYLFELTSVTVGNTLALGKAFRNRAGNYLLVLTSDYERLDFVLLEKCLPSGNGSGMGAGQKQVSIRPRVLTIERRKPNRIHLRVIRRFTWTESDPFAQYDKLLSAYTVAEWSEEFFNNRALFSDYYLLERLPGFSVWAEDPKPAYLRLLELYRGAASRFASTEKYFLKKELLEPIFEELGFRALAGKNRGKNITEPDYRLFPPSKEGAAAGSSSPLALGLVYPWGRFLDGKDYERDKENPDENPSAIVVSLLDKGESPWVVVTNGKLWRLYAQAAHSRATNYYEVDVEEILAQAGPYIADPAESFRYFWLFLSNPAPDDESPEAKAAEFLNTTKVPDRFLAQALNLLTRDVDPKRHDLVFIDYKSLGVRQLGSIYEGLLEFKLRISDRKLAIVKEKDHEIYKAFRNLDARDQEKAERQGRVIKKGQVYLENDKSERKATGSYYTPDHIVKYIVEKAVGAVLEEKFDKIRPKLREVQQRRRAFFQKQEALEKQGLKTEPESKAGLIGKELVDELFDLKVLDPAIGSGHFLVEAVDYITDKTLDFLNSFPWNPVFAYLGRTRETILQEMENQGITIDAKRLTDINLLKRHVLKRCIYGVDLNPMAVELAKVSLWLDCFTLGAPLSFLDHHLRCGNSLIGVTVKEVEEAVEPVTRVSSKTKVAASGKRWKTKESRVVKYTLFGSRFAGLLLATDLMRHVGELSDVTSEQVHESKSEYRKASDALAPFKRILDVYTSQWFGNEVKKQGKRKACAESPALIFLKKPEAETFITARDKQSLTQSMEALSPEDQQVVEAALKAKTEKRFFHWELEFPEVFYGPRPGTTQVIERREGAGFDAVIGNPPYDELSEQALGRILDDEEFLTCQSIYTPIGGGRLNWYHFFISRSVTLLKLRGCHGFIIPMSLLADQFTRSLRKWLFELNQLVILEAFPQKDDPENRVFRDAKLPTCLYVIQRLPPERCFYIRVHSGKYIFDDSPSYCADLKTLIAIDPDNLTIPLMSQMGWSILKKITEAEHLGKMRDFGAIPTSGEIVFNKAFRKYLTEDPNETLILRGSHVQRWEMADETKQGEPIYLKKNDYLKNAKAGSKAFHFQQPRVVYQECAAIDNWRRVIAAFLTAGNFCGHKICYFIDYKCSPLALLAVFNSKLINWLVTSISSNNSLPAYLVGSLPFPKFTNKVLNSKQQQELKRLIEIYKGEVTNSNALFLQLLALIGDLGKPLNISLDVLHGFLNYLGEQMIELNKYKQSEMNQFLKWLENELNIQSDSSGSIGINALEGKTLIKKYLGDYQKGEDSLPYENLLNILQRNNRRLGRTLDPAFNRQISHHYERSLVVLLPIKHELAATDQLIDQIVYRIYGLKEEEIALIEGKV